MHSVPQGGSLSFSDSGARLPMGGIPWFVPRFEGRLERTANVRPPGWPIFSREELFLCRRWSLSDAGSEVVRALFEREITEAHSGAASSER